MAPAAARASRADYANSIDKSDGYFYTTRIIDYQGEEQFCDANNVCTKRRWRCTRLPATTT